MALRYRQMYNVSPFLCNAKKRNNSKSEFLSVASFSKVVEILNVLRITLT